MATATQSRKRSIGTRSAPSIPRHLILHGVPLAHLNPMSSKHATALAEMKKNISTGMKAAMAAEPYQADLALRIPRAEVARHIALITKAAPSTTPAGSYRRGAATSADIDVVVREPIADIIAKLNAAGYIHHIFSAGPKKFSGIVRLTSSSKFRHLDIIHTTPESYPFAMLYFTGPARFNIVMRIKARRRGLKLNEYGLFRDTVPLPNIKTERDIFAALDVPYKAPADRDVK